MEKKTKILSYITLIIIAAVGLGETLTYVILGDIHLASIMIFALFVSVIFGVFSFLKVNPYYLLGSVIPYLTLSIVYLAIGYGHKAHWVFYCYDVGIAILTIIFIIYLIFFYQDKRNKTK